MKDLVKGCYWYLISLLLFVYKIRISKWVSDLVDWVEDVLGDLGEETRLAPSSPKLQLSSINMCILRVNFFNWGKFIFINNFTPIPMLFPSTCLHMYLALSLQDNLTVEQVSIWDQLYRFRNNLYLGKLVLRLILLRLGHLTISSILRQLYTLASAS